MAILLVLLKSILYDRRLIITDSESMLLLVGILINRLNFLPFVLTTLVRLQFHEAFIIFRDLTFFTDVRRRSWIKYWEVGVE